MKKLFTLMLFAGAALFMNVHAQKTLNLDTGSWETVSSSPAVTKTVTPTQHGYEVTYQFHKALVMPDEILPATDMWYLDGFMLNNVPGEPAYPYASDSFSIPIGYSASVDVLEEEWYAVESSVASGRAPQLLSDTTQISAATLLPLKAKQGWFPTTTAAKSGINTYKDIDILSVDVTPMQFDTYLGKARVCKTLKYEVVFIESSSILRGRTITPELIKEIETEYADDPYLTATTLNWVLERPASEGPIKATTTVMPVATCVAPPYLIITTSDYKNPVTEFANWKRTLGFDVIVSTATSWTPQSIKAEISRVKSLYPRLSYLLFVGNNYQVPAESVKTGPTGTSVLTDLQYALTAKRKADSNYDFLPDIKYGRIPVNNVLEAESVFSKIINYEKNAPSANDSFYSSPLLVSEFLDYTRDGQADMRNCQTSYEISAQLTKIGVDPIVEFYAKANENPLKWGDPAAVENEDGTTSIVADPDIPEFLRKPTYKWDVTAARIKEHLNTGTSQLYYFSHGDETGWSGRLNVSQLADLRNGSKLPVTFSMACLTGNFSQPGCFAEKLLTNPNGGTAAIYAFTEETYVAYTDVLAASFYNGMYPEMDYMPYIKDVWNNMVLHPHFDNDITITELGDLDIVAKTKVANAFPNNEMNKDFKEYEISMLTLFGDPSMNIYLTTPKRINASVSIKNNKLYVSSDPNAIITIFNRNTGEVANHKGSISGDELPTDYTALTLCVHKPGYLPYVKDMVKLAKKPSAETENKLVREDRIWTYYQEFCGTMKPSEDILLNVKFSGTTDINGKTYFNCYAWKAENEFSESECPIIAYMREEDNKVYAYYPFLGNSSLAPEEEILEKYGIDIMPTSPSLMAEDYPYTDCERMIFDFNLNEGDKMWFNKDEIQTEKSFLTITDVYDTEWDGNIFHTQKYDGGYFMTPYRAFEGVGAEFGLLPYPGAFPICYCHSGYLLIKMSDTDLNTLFKIPDNTGISDNQINLNIVETQFYDLQGRQVINPHAGIFIRTDIFENGARKVTKVIIE